ncbi:MAG: guanine deaminase [Bacteroidales bacterium]|nr:guanine deaminase [Bacteroidales bacterium]
MQEIKAYKGDIFHFLDDADAENCNSKNQYIENGMIVVEDGLIKSIGTSNEIIKTLPKGTEVIDYRDSLIVPGFVDAHIHSVQTESIASYGEQLLDWLNGYIFPTEKKFKDRNYAEKATRFFVNELLRNGTTTAAIFPSVHAVSTEVLFEIGFEYNMRLIAGKTMMNRNSVEADFDTPETAYSESRQLIEKWHGKRRLSYAVTPRFAPTSSEEQLNVASLLKKEFPGVYVQTHLAENKKEIEYVKKLFPWSKSYLEVYDHFDLLGDRSLFAHSIHLTDNEYQRIRETNSVVVHCPTSNLFLGSGLFDFKKANEFNLRMALGSDVGAGTSFSMLRTADEAYKVAALQGEKLPPLKSYYLMTLGGAKALSLSDKIGNFSIGKEADFNIINLNCTPLLEYRIRTAKTLEEKLFALMILGDDRAISETYVLGKSMKGFTKA